MDPILVIEDAPDFQRLVRAALGQCYDLTFAASLAEARARLLEREYALLILDIGLPDGDGFSFCTELKEQGKFRALPVIFLTGRTELEDKLNGFSLGGDDYIVKPFEGRELKARVQARLARLQQDGAGAEDGIIRVGHLRLKASTQRVYRDLSGGKKSELGLTPIEFKILYHLARHENHVISREQLLATVWGKQTHVFARATDKHVSSLRQKLGDDASCIETVSGAGYRFVSKSQSPVATRAQAR